MTLGRQIEYLLMRTVMAIFSALPLDTASSVGGSGARILGPFTRLHTRARTHLMRVFPSLSEKEAKKILRDMWDNLGRNLAEYPHLQEIAATRVVFENHAGMTTASLLQGPAIFISGHFANWEIAGPALLHTMNVPLHLLYRAANNRRVDEQLNNYRSMKGRLPTIPKSRGGMRHMIGLLKDNQKIGILIDQKYNEGLTLPFFGIPAPSSDAYVQLGQKFSCPVYPAQIIRLKGAHFRVIVHPPLTLLTPDGQNRPAADVVAEAHALLEEWIKQAPAQWLWVHRRWGKDFNP